ncbi:hypothetical protein E8E13_008311 [Curvularia kusanoi]|uniref:Uncharacterized protein n=1 Tax=Curvularia kusanoi TaxID=90978 RepID=A0A9P4WCN5_CURKU|nr:hypothetical protein E8E13_008311 [Curvularia kusanoi]
MPYILVHPLPAPYSLPYGAPLPIFTTSSRQIALFFHGHGWRVRHVYVEYAVSTPAGERSSLAAPAPDMTSSTPAAPRHTPAQVFLQSSSYWPTTRHLNNPGTPAQPVHDPDPDPDTETDACCTLHPPSAIFSCGPVTELHCYQIPVDAAMFRGPRAFPLQIRWLRYYAWGYIDVEDGNGLVDLRRVDMEAVRRRDEGERKRREKDAVRGLVLRALRRLRDGQGRRIKRWDGEGVRGG